MIGSVFMLIGILSDTHGRIGAAAAGIEALKAKGCEYFIHCGDVGSCDVLDCLAGLAAGFVFGNTDFDREELRRYSADIGVRCLETGDVLELDGKKLAVTHGDEVQILRRLLAGEPDYLLTGHTHVARDVKQGSTRWINPGALHRAAVKSVAVLDLEKDEVEFLEIKV